jgi:hypothetical protein
MNAISLRRLIPLILFTLLPARIVVADHDCDKARNDRGNRCEGLIDLEVSSPDLVLLSFAGYREPFDDVVDLRVRFFLSLPAGVVVRGRELRDRKQYWMESKAAAFRGGEWNEFGPWSTGEVLRREGIPHSNLGVLIEVENAQAANQVLAPAFVYHSRSPASIDRYTLHLRPNKALSQVTYSLYRLGDDWEETRVEGGPLGPKRASLPFPIRLDATHLDEGPLRLVIDAKVKNVRSGIHREIDFYHKPLIGQTRENGGRDAGAS